MSIENIDKLAQDVLFLSRNTLALNLRFMDKPISMLDLQKVPKLNGVAVDGTCIYYDPIRLPDGIKSIELSTFCNCYSLKDIVIPQSVRQIGAYAFENCRSLEAITLPDAMEFTDIRQLFGRTDLKKYYHRGQWHNIQ